MHPLEKLDEVIWAVLAQCESRCLDDMADTFAVGHAMFDAIAAEFELELKTH